MNITVGGDSEEENKGGNIVQEGEGDGEFINQVEEKLFRVISKMGKRPKIDVNMFFGNLNLDELID